MHSVPKSFAEIYDILALKPGVIIRIAKLSSNTFWRGPLGFRNPKTMEKFGQHFNKIVQKGVVD